MSVRLISLTIVGFLLGALAAGGAGVRVIREVRGLDDATSLPAQNIARADGYHADPGETLISSTALIPKAFAFGDGGLVISYDLKSLAPSFGIEASRGNPPLYPRRWLVEAIGGEFEGIQESPLEAVAVFPLMAGGLVDQIDEVRVVEAFIPAPFQAPVAVSVGEPKVLVREGLEIVLVDATSDPDTTTIEIRVIADENVVRDIRVMGDGLGWKGVRVEGEVVTLVREADSGSDAGFDLIVSGTSWVAADGEFVVDIGAFGG